jgi:hypothetical protein
VLVVGELEGGGTSCGAGVVLDGTGGVVTNGTYCATPTPFAPCFTSAAARATRRWTAGYRGFSGKTPPPFSKPISCAPTPISTSPSSACTPTPHTSRAPHSPKNPRASAKRIFALGHPNESVWSLTSGVVSSVRAGLVQHDAALANGSSGGPLLDARGRVVSINTSKLFEPAEGIGFARPVALVRKFAAGENQRP